MKKITLLALVFILVPSLAYTCVKDGTTWMYIPPFPDGVVDVYAGQELVFEWAYAIVGANDTICVWMEDTGGWDLGASGYLDACWLAGDPGYAYWGPDITVTPPCDVEICDYDTVYAYLSYCAADTCNHADSCLADADTLYLHVVEAPPALGVLQDSLTVVTEGQTAAYIAFAICNQDPCAAPATYYYNITSKGHVGGAINQNGSKVVDGGECENVYGVVDAGEAEPCDLDTLTIIAWDTEGTIYDTCVQLIHVVEVEPVPLFSTPVLTILVLAMILSAAVFMRRRATNKA